MTYLPAARSALPFAASPPLAACVHTDRPGADGQKADRLHVVAVDHSTFRTAHAAIDASGDVSVLPVLPLAYATGMATCAGSLVVTGVAPGDEEPVVCRLDAAGEADSLVELPVVGELLRWPVPLCRTDRIDVSWEIYAEPGTQVALCSPCDQVPSDDVSARDFPVFTSYAAVGVAEDVLVTARVDPARLVVVLTSYDDALRPVSRLEFGQDASYVDISWPVVAWVEGGNRLYAQSFGSDLSPIGPAVLVDLAEPPSTITDPRAGSASGRTGRTGRTAIAYDLVTVGDPQTLGHGPMPELGHPPRTTSARIGILEDGRVLQTLELHDRIHRIGWLGPDLLVLTESEVVVFRAS